MIELSTLDILQLSVTFLSALALSALALRALWLAAAAGLGLGFAVWRTVRLFTDIVGSDYPEINAMITTVTAVLTLPNLMWWLSAGTAVALVALLVSLWLLKHRARAIVVAPLICALGAPVPLLFQQAETVAPQSACGQSHLDVELAGTTLRLVPALDLFVRTMAPGGRVPLHRYSTADDAIGGVARTCEALAGDNAEEVLGLTTGIWWRDAPEWATCDADLCPFQPPANASRIQSVALFDPATTDTSPEARRAQFRFDDANATSSGTIDGGGYACRSAGGTTQCMVWATLVTGPYVEVQSAPASTALNVLPNQIDTTTQAQIIGQAESVINWVAEVWVQPPESP